MDDDQDLVNRIFFVMMYGSFNPEEQDALERIVEAAS